MEIIVKTFFKDFFQKNKREILYSSFWRLFACVQSLFWPFAFAKIVNIMTETPENWQKVIPWISALILNKATEDFIRLRSKYKLQRIIIKLKTRLTCFFTQETELKEGAKTGEAVQDIKKATETTEGFANYYKDDLLQLPVNLIIIPIILFNANTWYFVMLAVFALIYLLVDYFWATIYAVAQEKSLKAGEELWGATYRKAPEVWRAREDGSAVKQLISEKADEFFKRNSVTQNIHYWRWIFVQVVSTLSRGLALVFVLCRIIKGSASVGDLVLVSGYFAETQSSLNMVTSTTKLIIDWRASLRELSDALKKKS